MHEWQLSSLKPHMASKWKTSNMLDITGFSRLALYNSISWNPRHSSINRGALEKLMQNTKTVVIVHEVVRVQFFVDSALCMQLQGAAWRLSATGFPLSFGIVSEKWYVLWR